MIIGLSIYTLTAACSWICLAYRGFAKNSNWPVIKPLQEDFSWPKLLAFASMAWACLRSIQTIGLWAPFVILIFGFFVAFIATFLMRSRIQVVAIAGLIAGSIGTILYISESQPLGFVHNLISP